MSKTALRVALRKVNEKTSLPYSPDHDFDTLEPLKDGEVAKLEMQLSPSSTFFRKGDELRLVIQGQYFIDGKKIHQLVYDTFSENRLRLLGYSFSETFKYRITHKF